MNIKLKESKSLDFDELVLGDVFIIEDEDSQHNFLAVKILNNYDEEAILNLEDNMVYVYDSDYFKIIRVVKGSFVEE